MFIFSLIAFMDNNNNNNIIIYSICHKQIIYNYKEVIIISNFIVYVRKIVVMSYAKGFIIRLNQ